MHYIVWLPSDETGVGMGVLMHYTLRSLLVTTRHTERKEMGRGRGREELLWGFYRKLHNGHKSGT